MYLHQKENLMYFISCKNKRLVGSTSGLCIFMQLCTVLIGMFDDRDWSTGRINHLDKCDINKSSMSYLHRQEGCGRTN